MEAQAFEALMWFAEKSPSRKVWSLVDCFQEKATELQGGTLLVINGILTPLNGLINE